MSERVIPQQVRLPARVAAAVVAQGIRIRFGRSLVTLTGITLGIAFLMSVLTGQALKRGVAEEDRLREEANRRYGYLAAETGSLYERPLAVLVTGTPSPVEERLLRRVEREQVGELRTFASGAALLGGALGQTTPRVVPSAAAFADRASAVLVIGDGPLPALPWETVLAGLRRPIVAFAAARPTASIDGAALVPLSRDLAPEQRARLAAAAERERFRGLWIIAISLLVTVIGISNAMLMSVTERFRDIGTMKCLGATARFIRSLFLLEASLLGLVGGVVGTLLGLLVSCVTYVALYGLGLTASTVAARAGSLLAAAGLSIFAGAALSIVAALYPARFASRMVPADALRSNI